MKLYALTIMLLTGLWLQAQDLDIYKKEKNSNFEIPPIPKEMTYEEFKILSTNLRMQDMFIGMILPGHVHFKIDEHKTGYYLLGIRSLGYGIWGYLALKKESVLNIIFFDKLDFIDDTSTGDKIAAYSSVILIAGSYLYDWIHGRYKLDSKQNKIRYKYAQKRTKLAFSLISTPEKHRYPGLTLSYSF